MTTDTNPTRRVAFPDDDTLDNSANVPLTSSPPSSPPGPNLPPTSPDGVPRKRPTRSVTVDTEGTHPTRRATSDSINTNPSGRDSHMDPNVPVLRRMTTGLFTPSRKIGAAPTYKSSIKAAVLSSWM